MATRGRPRKWYRPLPVPRDLPLGTPTAPRVLPPRGERKDALGTVHPVAGRNPRIVALVPSITETLFAFDLGMHVVGRTGFCIRPKAAVTRVPKVGGTKDVKLDALRALHPTHVIVNMDENDARTVATIRTFVPHVLITHPNAPEDNRGLYRLLGAVFDRRAHAVALCAALEVELAACAAGRAAGRLPDETVLYLIWKDPWMTVAADTYIARTLAAVGWRVTHGRGGRVGAARYPVVTDLDAAAERAARVLLASEPYPFRSTDAAPLRARWRGKLVSTIDAGWTSWYGVRAIDGLRRLRLRRAG